jgi:hypothetical protein
MIYYRGTFLTTYFPDPVGSVTNLPLGSDPDRRSGLRLRGSERNIYASDTLCSTQLCPRDIFLQFVFNFA